MASRKKHEPDQIAAKLRDADVMLNSGKDLTVVLQRLGVSKATYHRWREQYGGMKPDEAKRLKELELENSRLERLERRMTCKQAGAICEPSIGARLMPWPSPTGNVDRPNSVG